MLPILPKLARIFDPSSLVVPAAADVPDADDARDEIDIEWVGVTGIVIERVGESGARDEAVETRVGL